MPKVVDAARITTRGGTIWRVCAGCGQLAALSPDMTVCPSCDRPARPMVRRAPRERHELVGLLSGPAVIAVRDVYARTAADVLRVAALVEISAAAAALARTVVKFHHLDLDLIAGYVRDATDLHAVLGRGQWLPTMTRHVPTPPTGPVPIGLVLPAVLPERHAGHRDAAQLSLFDGVSAAAGGAR
jgi:hypothetical protein